METTPNDRIVDKVLELGEQIANLVDKGNDNRIDRSIVHQMSYDLEDAVLKFRVFAEAEFRIRREKAITGDE